ncbi:MAG: hypothetical protein E7551_10225 [Ruminococcaceae bacterium]|nr:hypothetical protein [Oscillospiraceae bacterium]
MKLKYLGTAAAEGIPALFCDCEVCKRSMELGGKNIRTRSQAIIDNTLLIDFPPDTYWHFIQHKLPMDKIQNCLVTHSHQDHLYAPDIYVRKKGFANFSEEKPPLNFYVGKDGCKKIDEVISSGRMTEAKTHLVKAGDVFEVEGYRVTALEASHDPKSNPLIYIIEKDGKSVFYSNDTSDYPKSSWEILKKYGKHISLISLDCTEGTKHIEYIGHMNLERCIAIREKLKSVGVADQNTVFVLHHFSHNGGNSVYEDFKEIAAKEGFLVSFDGMEIEV